MNFSNAGRTLGVASTALADYRVMYLATDYSHTVIGREKRDDAWIMARSPSISEADYRRLSTPVRTQGYDITRPRKAPQQPVVRRSVES